MTALLKALLDAARTKGRPLTAQERQEIVASQTPAPEPKPIAVEPPPASVTPVAPIVRPEPDPLWAEYLALCKTVGNDEAWRTVWPKIKKRNEDQTN